MKKSILIICIALTTFSLMAFGLINWNDSKTNNNAGMCNGPTAEQNEVNDFEIYYGVGNRWDAIPKEELNKRTSIEEFFTDGKYTRKSFRNVRIDIIHNDKDVRDIKTSEVGQTQILNEAQLKLLRSMDYSTNLRVSTLCERTNVETGVTENDSSLCYITIVPEKEAEYDGGFEAVIEYVKENSKEKASVIKKDKVQPGKVFFTVTKNGTLDKVHVSATCGYPAVDDELKNIISNMPQKWVPAENSKGEKVDQEFMFLFGSIGC